MTAQVRWEATSDATEWTPWHNVNYRPIPVVVPRPMPNPFIYFGNRTFRRMLSPEGQRMVDRKELFVDSGIMRYDPAVRLHDTKH